MDIVFKDIVLLVVGVVIGFVFGVAIYWLPLGQFLNEYEAIWNLVWKRYSRGDDLVVKAGTDFKSLGQDQTLHTITRNTPMKFWHDEGIGWYFTSSGWKRVRILHVYTESSEQLYRICHKNLD